MKLLRIPHLVLVLLLATVLIGGCYRAKPSAAKADQETEPSLLVPPGYWRSLKQLSNQDWPSHRLMDRLPAAFPKESPLTLRAVAQHINQQLAAQPSPWRLVIEITFPPQEDFAPTDTPDPFEGLGYISYKTPEDYLDSPITELRGRRCTPAELRQAIETMSLESLLYVATTFHSMAVIPLENHHVVLANGVCQD